MEFNKAYDKPIDYPCCPGEKIYTWTYVNEDGVEVTESKNVFKEIQIHFYYQVLDSEGNRLIMCKKCGKIDKTNAFISYGGKDTMNWGECNECYNNRRKENGI